MNQQLYSAMRNLVIQNESRLRLGRTSRQIVDLFGVGKEAGGSVLFSEEDISRLISKIKEQYGHDLRFDREFEELSQGRYEMSKVSVNEKESPKAVFDRYIQVTSNGEIPMRQGGVRVPNKTLLMCDHDDVLWERVDAVVITENGVAAQRWQEAEVDGLPVVTVMIYRGHDYLAKHVLNAVELAKEYQCKIYGFFDVDPKGLELGLSLEADGVVIPAVLDIEDLSYRDRYQDQIGYLGGLENKVPESLREYYHWMTSGRVAINQELLISRKVSLVVHEVA